MSALPHDDEQRASLGTGYLLVHHAAKPRFAPLQIMNPVTYLGRLPINDVVLESENVSRRHAKLIVTDLGVTVHDLDSHNGVFLNGKKVRSTPVSPGDLVYIGDVCVELQRSTTTEPFARSATARLDRTDATDLSADNDPATRGLAALLRGSSITATSHDESWRAELVEVCRELTESSVAVLVEVDGTAFKTPVVLQPDTGRRNDPPVLWEVVQQAVKQMASRFSPDLVDVPLPQVTPGPESRAVMCTPIVVSDRCVGALYLSRPQAGAMFTELELEAVQAISALAALRLQRGRASSADDSSLSRRLDSQGADLDALRARTTSGAGDVESWQQARQEFERRLAAVDDERAQAESRVEALGKVLDGLRRALRALLPPMVGVHLEAAAGGAPLTTTTAELRPVTVLAVSLHGFDAWVAGGQSSADIRARLDRFCDVAMTRAVANGGRLEQVCGHEHVFVFVPDASGVRSSVRCALEIVESLAREGIAVTAGMDVGQALGGFYGGPHASFVEAGPAVLTARAAIAAIPGSSGLIVTDQVRTWIEADSGVGLVRLGRCLLQGLRMPIALHLVQQTAEDAENSATNAAHGGGNG